MNIVYILPEMSHPGGIGRVTAIKANFFANEGNNVTIITEIQGNKRPYYELNKNIKHYDIGLNTNGNKILKLILRKKRIKKILELIHPDIVIYTFFILPIRCKFKYKTILECHFNHDAPFLKAKAFNSSILLAKILTRYHEYIASKTDVLVVLTNQDKMMWEKTSTKSNIIVIPNMNSFTTNQVSDLTNKNVIAVGRLDAQKNFDKLITIWSKVHLSHKDWHLNIYGKGPDKIKLETLIKKLELKNSVFINEPTKDIKDKYLQSSILCFTSTYEGWGLVLTEAMSCGLPVVSYDIPCGPKDIIKNNYNGFLIRNDDEDEFANSLSLLMDNKTIRESIGKNALESIKKYNIDAIMKEWNNLINKII